MRRRWVPAFGLCALCFVLVAMLGATFTPASAHEVRPGYLQISQTAPHAYKVTWKQPTMGDVAIHLVPHISNGWLERQPADEFVAAGFLIKTWNITAKEKDPLTGRTIAIEGLEQTITDVFVRISLNDGRTLAAIVRPEHPVLDIAFGMHGTQSALMYMTLGVEHILTGPDHLLFVLGLLLIVADRWTLLRTVSAFTIAHSITLAIATLFHVAPQTALLNSLIALSILFLGPEIVRYQHGGTSLTIRRPWIVAFAFGLLHGFGFASGLLSLGLPHSEIPLALLMFNVGVEIGQIAFIALILGLERAFRLMEFRWPRPVIQIPTYVVGGLGAFWTIAYSVQLLGGAL